jgi:hypothetical protein
LGVPISHPARNFGFVRRTATLGRTLAPPIDQVQRRPEQADPADTVGHLAVLRVRVPWILETTARGLNEELM